MPLRIEWEPAARRAFRKLPDDAAAPMAEALAHFAETERGDVVKLVGVKPPAYRLRTGDWRIIFDWDQTARVIVVLRVVNRRDAYR